MALTYCTKCKEVKSHSGDGKQYICKDCGNKKNVYGY